MTLVEKILAAHAGRSQVSPGEIVDVAIDTRLARDFGGAAVVKNLTSNSLRVADPNRTFFTFDCNPTGSDQLYASNQQKCRVYARANHIRVYDINSGIGTHLAIDEGLALPGSTLVSTDSHANVVGAVGAFGQGMGDRDIAAAWAKGSVWFSVPESVKIILNGHLPSQASAKDLVLHLLQQFGADSLLGYSVELYGEAAESLALDERITISSMATELGAICILFPPSQSIVRYCQERSLALFDPVFADPDATYAQIHTLNVSTLEPLVSLPGEPHRVSALSGASGRKIDSVFIGSCTNGRMDDMRMAASILAGRKVAPGVMLKIVPATDSIWNDCLREGIIEIFKSAGALVGNAGCAGCASGQIGQNGPGEVTISTGNRNFEGKQGKGEVYLASVQTAAASALAGFLTGADQIPSTPATFAGMAEVSEAKETPVTNQAARPLVIEGRAWVIDRDHIDTDMIYHNRHLAVTDLNEMGKYAFGNLKGWENFPEIAEPGDILFAGRNFGAGSSRQHAVDCFKALECGAIVARSFGAIYERNAINAGFPVLTLDGYSELGLSTGNRVQIDLVKGVLTNLHNGMQLHVRPFSDIQLEIYKKGDLLRL